MWDARLLNRHIRNFSKQNFGSVLRFFSVIGFICRKPDGLAKKENDSNNWYKTKSNLAKTHENVANIRKDFYINFLQN